MDQYKTALGTRAKILGVLLKDARLTQGKSLGECAEALDCPVTTYSAYEVGHKSPSLPELELLSYFLNVPVSHFWGSQMLSAGNPRDHRQLPKVELRALRDRIIGAQVRKARSEARIGLKDLAAELGLKPARLYAYEFGHRPIPLPVLERIADRLRLALDHFLVSEGPIGEWDSAQRAFERFTQLPPELREFVSQPANESYLRLAHHLSQLSTDRLRGIAESLLEITY